MALHMKRMPLFCPGMGCCCTVTQQHCSYCLQGSLWQDPQHNAFDPRPPALAPSPTTCPTLPILLSLRLATPAHHTSAHSLAKPIPTQWWAVIDAVEGGLVAENVTEPISADRRAVSGARGGAL
jgi:hypothetical protein